LNATENAVATNRIFDGVMSGSTVAGRLEPPRTTSTDLAEGIATMHGQAHARRIFR